MNETIKKLRSAERLLVGLTNELEAQKDENDANRMYYLIAHESLEQVTSAIGDLCKIANQ